MQLTQQEIRYQFLDGIMKERNISYKSIYKYRENNEKEISNMNRIFDSDDTLSIRKRLVLLSLISQDQARENLEYYLNIKHIEAGSIGSDTEEFKTALIAALMSNNLFFIRACNWCGIIQREVSRMKEASPDKLTIESAKAESNVKMQSILLFIVTKEENRITYFNPNPEAIMSADGSTDTGLKILERFRFEDIHGRLDLLADTKQYKAKLIFEFDEVQDTVPFGLKFCFTTRRDKEPHVIEIPADEEYWSKDKGKITNSKSVTEYGIDCSGGIDSDYKVIITWQNAI